MKRKSGAIAASRFSDTQLDGNIVAPQLASYERRYAHRIANATVSIETKQRNAHTKPEHLLMEALKRGNLDSIAQLVHEGCDINFHDTDGLTPLMKAVHLQHKALTLLFISHGADLNAQGPYGNTALHYAVLKGESSDGLDILDILLYARVNVNIQNDLGQTPLHFHKTLPLTAYIPIAKRLLQAGALLHFTDIKGNTPFSTLDEATKNELLTFGLLTKFNRA